jgi:hypothetical protein
MWGELYFSFHALYNFFFQHLLANGFGRLFIIIVNVVNDPLLDFCTLRAPEVSCEPSIFIVGYLNIVSYELSPDLKLLQLVALDHSLLHRFNRFQARFFF